MSTSPVTTRPVLMPVCIEMGRPILFSISGLRASTSSWISLAALIALTGSSSWPFGAPKRAITASPTNFSINPWYLPITSEILPKIRLVISFTSSGSSFSDIAVYPERSENKTVTYLRSPSASATCFSASATSSNLWPH